MDKPDALRLANVLDNEVVPENSNREAAAELRRLHAQRGALLEALREAQACFITQDITRQEYERLYPDAVEETK